LIPVTFLNSRESNVRFAREENEIIVTVSTLKGVRNASAHGATAEIIAVAASESQVDRRLLIDGRLVGAGKTFPSLNPATGLVVGHAPDAGVEQAEAAIAAARRAFDTTSWPTEGASA
jgi:hypothetical protein